MELQGYWDDYEISLQKTYHEHKKDAIHGFIKNIEIRKQDFLMLFLWTLSLLSLFIVNMTAVLAIRENFQNSEQYIFLSLITGLVVGAIVSVPLLDQIKKKITIFLTIHILTILTSILTLPYIYLFQIFGSFPLFLVNGFLFSFLLLLYFRIFLDTSFQLERGRILSFLLIPSLVISVTLTGVLSLYVSNFYPLIIILLTPNILSIYLNNRYAKAEIASKSPPLFEESHINWELIKYSFFFLFLSILMGIVTPDIQLQNLILYFSLNKLIQENMFILVLIFLLVAGIIIALFGFIFDLIGRLASISSLILFIAIISLLKILKISSLFFQNLILSSFYIGVLMTMTCVIGDLTKEKNFGKVFSLFFLLFIIGVALGSFLKNFLIMIDNSNRDILILGFEYLSSVIALLFLVNSKETLPHKEKEWFDSLIHLYVIHESGLLLYDHDFSKNEVRIPESDLISGGIIGLTAVLEEITKGEEQLRVIDHGDKKLLFKYSPFRDIIFLLVIKNDLLILRDKLDKFALNFIHKHKKELDKVNEAVGVKASDFYKASDLVKRHFTQKYFTLIDDLIK